jgi:hypothetical protein
MREFVRPAAALGVAWLFASLAIGSSSGALAQAQLPTAPAQVTSAKLPPVRQIALTEKQIKGMLAASKDMDVITDNAPEDIDKLSAETTEKLDAVARRNGLASYDEYKVIGENIGLVFGGFDTGSEPAQRLKPSGMFAKGMTPARQRVIIPSPCDRREQQD